MSFNPEISPQLNFFGKASTEFIRHLDAHSERVSGPMQTFTGHLLYDAPRHPFDIEVAQTPIDRVQLDIVSLLNQKFTGKPGTYQRVVMQLLGFHGDEPANIEQFKKRDSEPSHAYAVVSGGERLPTMMPRGDLFIDDYSRATVLNDEQCISMLDILVQAEPGIYGADGQPQSS